MRIAYGQHCSTTPSHSVEHNYNPIKYQFDNVCRSNDDPKPSFGQDA